MYSQNVSSGVYVIGLLISETIVFLILAATSLSEGSIDTTSDAILFPALHKRPHKGFHSQIVKLCLFVF